ncbi:MAG TPA: hypothetical protein EYP29_05805, partial [Thermoplasmata archaeon]|nr:hypothetical protein [Thermoplasmata archaeon]
MLKELETRAVIDAPHIEILPLPTDSRDAAFNLFNEQKRLYQSEEFRKGLANQLTYYVAEFILRLPLQPFYYQESFDGGKKRLTSPGFADEDMLVSFSQPYQINRGLTINSVEKVE